MPYHLPLSQYKLRQKTDSVVIHCADTYAHQNITIADVRKWHIEERKWIDVGYHFFIRRDGTLEVGRPFYAVGAGVEGWNADSVHICLAGGKANLGGPENNFTAEQFRTLRALLVTITEIDPGGERILGHRDYPGVTKYCPSFDVAEWLKKTPL